MRKSTQPSVSALYRCTDLQKIFPAKTVTSLAQPGILQSIKIVPSDTVSALSILKDFKIASDSKGNHDGAAMCYFTTCSEALENGVIEPSQSWYQEATLVRTQPNHVLPDVQLLIEDYRTKWRHYRSWPEWAILRRSALMTTVSYSEVL